MKAALDHPSDSPLRHAASRATVTRLLPPRKALCRSRLGETFPAGSALPGYEPRVGDVVLLLEDDEGGHHIVGVLASLRVAETQPSQDAPSGARFDGPRFEHDPASGKTVLHAPGDLELHAARGSIRWIAKEVDVTAAHTRWQSDRMEIVARTLTTAAERSTTLVGILETRATRVIERAKTAYREVEDLAQTRAGRIRQIAETTWQVLGKRTLIKAEEDVKIRGEKIHLA